MPERIVLKVNDDRLGSVDGDNTLIFPAFDALGNPYSVRSSMQVVWVSDRQFVVFPYNVSVGDYEIHWNVALSSDELAIVDRINASFAEDSDVLKVSFSASKEGEIIITDVSPVEDTAESEDTSPEPEHKPEPKPKKKGR